MFFKEPLTECFFVNQKWSYSFTMNFFECEAALKPSVL